MKITGIGSLPHHNVDSALEYAFAHDLPFLPQIPIRHPSEFMIHQALFGMPGLHMEAGGFVSLDREEWKGAQREFEAQLDRALESGDYSQFEPRAGAFSCWKPFLFELEQRQCKEAKVQLAGPLTCQWILRLSDGTPADLDQQVAMQTFRLVLVKSLAMVQALKDRDVEPVIFLDEPGLCTLDVSNPRHLTGLSELKLVIQALKKEGARVGLHCCSNTDWERVLGLGLDILSVDASLSLTSLESSPSLKDFSGALALGVVPTGRKARALDEVTAQDLLPKGPLVEQTQYLSAACGLALRPVEETQRILTLLTGVKKSLS